MQQTIGAFDPRPVVSVLIVVAVFFAGLSATRLSTRNATREAVHRRGAELRRILGVWPAEALPASTSPGRGTESVDAVRLGVFPARRDVNPARPYVDRLVDDPLRAALKAPGAVVLVFGAPRSGKSRTALEAACAALPGARLLAPRGPRALTDLLALSPPIDLGDVPTVVWLDDLERYAGSVDAATLDQLQDLTGGSTIITTVRREDWQALLGDSGDRGETARALAARAQAFEVPTELEPAEQAEAACAYPGVDLAGGIGAALSGSGKEAEPPPARVKPPADERDSVPPARRDPQLLVPGAGALGAVAALALVWVLAGFSTPTPPTVGEQIGAIKRAGSQDGRQVRVYGPVDLRGSGEASYLFQFQDGPGSVSSPRSDQLRVYDVLGTRLVPRLRFEPVGPRAVFQYRSSADVDQDNSAEIVGGYGESGTAGARQALVPFAINWDDAAQRYKMVSIDLGAPTLSRPAADVPSRQYRAVYARPTTYSDPQTNTQITAHRVQDFVVTRPPRRLVAAYFLRPPLGDREPLFEIHPTTLLAGAAPRVTPCVLEGSPLIVVPGNRKRLPSSVIADAWSAASRGRFCGPP